MLVSEDMSKEELAEVASEKGLSFNSRVTKKQLVALINKSDNPEKETDQGSQKKSGPVSQEPMQDHAKFDKFK